MNISIKQRIRWSFSLLVVLFVINGVFTIITLKSNKKLATDLFMVLSPSIQTLDDFNKMLIESKMYTTNWVFLRYNTEDKKLLKKIHDTEYEELKSRLNEYSSKWAGKNWIDSVHNIYKVFDELLVIEKNIIASLNEFNDYDDPVIKLEAERKIEEEILPRTTALKESLNGIHNFVETTRANVGSELERSSTKLRVLIVLLIISIIIAGFLLSAYLTKVIINPVNRINQIITNLGRGIIQKIEEPANNNEIGMMIHSVNNLSEKLEATARFAQETGLRNFDVPFKPLSDEDTLGMAILAMRENLKTSETNLAIQNKELEQKNKELEEFAYVASHDLQEPLRTTSSFVELLDKQYKGKLDEKADKYLSFITQSSDRMQVLIMDLLEYSRIGSKKGEMELIDCNDILEDVMNDLAAAISESDADITAEVLPEITGYETEIKQLFQNLIFNAIKFRKKDTRPKIYISAFQKRDSWQIAFTDNGIGIAQEHFERIFTIFQRLHTRNEYQGSGIGLSHCKKIVELHKGKIWLESKLSEGTTFFFTIPIGSKKVNNGKISHAVSV